jgi:hypothetical protein
MTDVRVGENRVEAKLLDIDEKGDAVFEFPEGRKCRSELLAAFTSQ